MSVLRTIHCDVCGATCTEEKPGGGWPGWGQLNGVAIDGIDNPHLCPSHLRKLAETVDRMRSER